MKARYEARSTSILLTHKMKGVSLSDCIDHRQVQIGVLVFAGGSELVLSRGSDLFRDNNTARYLLPSERKQTQAAFLSGQKRYRNSVTEKRTSL